VLLHNNKKNIFFSFELILEKEWGDRGEAEEACFASKNVKS